MSYLTVYSENYTPHRLRANKPFRPEDRLVETHYDWLDSGYKTSELKLDDKERERILKTTAKNFWGTSTYQSHYCDSSNEDFDGNRDSLIVKKDGQDVHTKFSRISDPENELMKAMKSVFERDPHRSVRQPMNTHRRIMGYCRPSNYQCGLSVYQHDISKPGYVCMRDHLIQPLMVDSGILSTTKVSPIFSLPDA